MRLVTPEVGSSQPLLSVPGWFEGARPVGFFNPTLALIHGRSTTGRSLLRAADLAGQRSHDLSSPAELLGRYAMAPDGSRVAYLARVDVQASPFRLYSIRTDGSDRVELTRDIAPEIGVSNFVWSESSEKIGVFLEDGSEASLWVVDAAGDQAPVHVADPLGRINPYTTVFDRDDTRLLYADSGENNTASSQLHSALLNAPAQPAATILEPSLLQPFRLSPDGSWVAYRVRAEAASSCARIQRSESGERREPKLEGLCAQGTTLVWSAEGKHVVGSDNTESNAPWVYAFGTDSTRSLALDGFAITHFVGLAPRGSWALVEGRAERLGPGELFVFDLDRAAQPPRSLGEVPEPQEVHDPIVSHYMKWSADGRYVFFKSGATSELAQVVRIDVRDGTRDRLGPEGPIHSFALVEGCCGL